MIELPKIPVVAPLSCMGVNLTKNCESVAQRKAAEGCRTKALARFRRRAI